MNRRWSMAGLALSSLFASGCFPSGLCAADPDVIRPDHWTEPTHCRGVTPNYEMVFDDERVHVIELTISGSDHDATLEDLDQMLSGGSAVADLDALPKPIWVPATVRYDGNTWTQVAMRYKGHSSLKAAWQSGVRKLSFILEFDRFADDVDELKNQRFYGFKKLSFSNGYNDPSLLRDKVAADIFRAGGVPAARSTFAAITLNWGEGPTYLGLYTMIEDPCDQMLATQLGDGSGNLYKPWGDAARWLGLETIGKDELTEYFERCSSKDPAPLDVADAISRLHADRSDATSWRAGLEELFDVQAFIKALAINQTIVNWDSYGCMHHNYFVYANPKDGGRLLWFPWDLNESMLSRQQSGCPDPGSVMLNELVTEQDGIDAKWPLIRYILAEDPYRQAYRAALRATLDGPFEASSLIAQMRRYNELIAPYVVGPTQKEAYPYTNCSEQTFNTSLQGGRNALEDHVHARHTAVETALASTP